jgi:fumarate hydratase class II
MKLQKLNAQNLQKSLSVIWSNQMSFRIEKDTMGEVKVPSDKYWGAQTQRSLENFPIGKEKMPLELIYSFAYLKKACARVNTDLGRLDREKYDAISQVCDAILAKKYDDNFPLSLWQTGSGTQSNMNVNEVIANLATEYLGVDFVKEKLIHPNDDVNKGQSSNDTFPSAMRIASVIEVETNILPAIIKLRDTLYTKQQEFEGIIKIGRTHLQDATPLSLSQEFSGYVAMLDSSYEQIKKATFDICNLAIGATAVGTGINSHPQFSQKVSDVLNDMIGLKIFSYVSQPNKFHALTSHDGEVFLSGALKGLSANLMKIANDIRWLASGPRCGLGELRLPENEPGSSIMPGKVNPTQAEAVTMVAVQVAGNDVSIGFGASQGNFELNVFKPVIAYNLLQSIELLSDCMNSFSDRCVIGIEPVKEKIDENLHNSLMLITALNPYIGYENCAKIAKIAHKNGTTLKEEAINSKLISATEFDKYVKAEDMIKPKE